MPPVGFEPSILAGDRLQIHALDRSATGIGNNNYYSIKYITFLKHYFLILLSNVGRVQFVYNKFYHLQEKICNKCKEDYCTQKPC